MMHYDRGPALAGCSTAQIGIEFLDETIGLPSALLRAGFKTVAATMWPVRDDVVFVALAWLLQLESNDEWPKRIQSTRVWLRTATTAEVSRFVDATADRFGIDDSFRHGISRMLASLPASVVPYDDPADWAALASFGLG